MAIEVIEWKDDSGREMVWRFAGGGELKLGAQLVVSENQWALFFRDGKALDSFGPGRHTLTTANIPLLQRLKEPVVFRDRELSMVRLRAHGAFATRVTDPQLFVNQIVGSRGRTTTDAVEGYLREIIVARLNDVLGETVQTLFDLPQHYDELAEGLKGRVAGDFGKYGLELTDFYIGAIVPPEDVQKVIDERTGMAAIGDPNAYLKFKAARALGDAAANPGGEGSAATGVGLGAGIGLGASMAQMMKDAMSSGSGGGPAAAAGGGFCTNCGAKLSDGAKFCGACGAKRA